MGALIIGKNMFRNIPGEKVLRFAIKYGSSKAFDSHFLKFGKYSPLPKKPRLIIYSPSHIQALKNRWLLTSAQIRIFKTTNIFFEFGKYSHRPKITQTSRPSPTTHTGLKN